MSPSHSGLIQTTLAHWIVETGHVHLFPHLLNGVSPATGLRFLYETIHPACYPMDTPSISRETDGTLLVQRLDGECISREGACARYVGQIVELPCRPPFTLRGASGIAMRSSRRTVSTMWVESLSPDSYEQGQSYTVTVTGYGFTASSVVEFLLPETDTIHPGITITEIRLIDAETLEVDIDVAVDAVLLDELAGWIAYDDLGAPS